MALGALGKDVQDQAGTVDHMALEKALQVTLLCRAQGMVEHHDIRIQRIGRFPEFLGLARANEQRRVRARAFAGQHMHRHGAGGGGQQGKLAQAFLKIVLAKIHAYEDGT